MAFYVTRHAAPAATGATTFANNPLGVAESIIATGPIKALGVSLSKSITDVAGAGITISIRLSGTGIQGTQDITMGSLTSDTTSTGGAKAQQPFYLDVDIPCTTGSTVTAQVLVNGVDPGTLEVDLTLVFG
jgi:hypothetical protein